MAQLKSSLVHLKYRSICRRKRRLIQSKRTRGPSTCRNSSQSSVEHWALKRRRLASCKRSWPRSRRQSTPAHRGGSLHRPEVPATLNLCCLQFRFASCCKVHEELAPCAGCSRLDTTKQPSAAWRPRSRGGQPPCGNAGSAWTSCHPALLVGPDPAVVWDETERNIHPLSTISSLG